MIPRVGDRVKMTGLMPDDPCPIEVGTEGTVVGIGAKIQGRTQIDVKWDNGRTLFLLDTDPFTVLTHHMKCLVCGRPVTYEQFMPLCEICDFAYLDDMNQGEESQ